MTPIGSHSIGRGNSPQSHHIFIGSFISHDTNRLDRQQDGPSLPDTVIESKPVQGLNIYVIGFLDQAYFFTGDLTKNPDSKSGPGKWVSLQER
jgi:hypothetical protein